MAGMLLLNPRRRRKARANPRRAKRPRANPFKMRRVAPRRARRANPRRRRRNPMPMVAMNPRKRRRRSMMRANPSYRRRRRHRNPLGINTSGIMGLLKDSAVMGVGAVGFQLAFDQINTMLPASLQSNPNTVGVGDAVQVAFTVALGEALNKPTRGLSRKAALGSLTVQIYDLVSTFLPSAVTPSNVQGLGWTQPAPVIAGQAWIGPNKRRPGAGMRGVGFLTRPAHLPRYCAEWVS